VRAINDCNIPKFTSKDVPLFNAIISDLFPNMEEGERDYGKLHQAIEEVADDHFLTRSEVLFFIIKFQII